MRTLKILRKKQFLAIFQSRDNGNKEQALFLHIKSSLNNIKRDDIRETLEGLSSELGLITG